MSNEECLLQLLDRWEDSWERGTPLAAEELCRDFPELIEPLQRRIEELKIVGSALDRGREFDTTTPTPRGKAEVPAGTDQVRPTEFRAMGGFGDVYVARDNGFGRTIVAKFMKNWRTADADAIRRFFLEADVTAKLQHPGIVPVYDKGRDTEGRPYYTMRFVDSQTLADEINELHRGAPVDWTTPEWNFEFRRLLRSLIAVCETVAYAHAQDYIHRDIKPSNIMVGPFGETLVLDWGLAKPVGNAETASDDDTVLIANTNSPGSTVEGYAKGSPAYMSPEQAAGEWKRVGPASDVYSLGATLCTLLTGQPPYRGPVAEVLKQVKAGRFAPPRQVNAAVPRALEAICLRAMSFRPEDRYRSAKELALDLERWLANAPVTAWPEPWTVRTRRWLEQHRTWVAGISAAMVMLLAGLGGVVAVQHNANESLTEINDQLKVANEKERQATEEARRALDQLQEQFYQAQMDLASNSLFEGNGGRASELVDTQWARPGQRDRRLWEWYHLWHLLHREQRVLQTGKELIGCVAFSPRGRTLAAGKFDGRILLWNLDSDEQKFLKGHTALVHDAAFSSDGLRLASTGNDGQVMIWDLATLQPTPLRGPSAVYLSIAFSPDGSRLATGGTDGSVRLWDPSGSRDPVTLAEHRGNVWGVAFSPDGTLLAAAATDGDVTLWNVSTETLVHRFSLGSPLECLAFHPDGSVIAAGTIGGGVQLLDPVSHKVVGTVPASSACRAVAFSPDGNTLAVVENFGSIMLNKATSQPTTVGTFYLWHHPDVTSVAFAADNETLVAGDEEGNLVVWDLHQSQEPLTLAGNSGAIFGLACSPNQKHIASFDLSDQIVVRGETGEVERVLRVPDGRVGSIAFSPVDNVLVSGNLTGTLQFWDAADGRMISSVGGSGGVGTALAFSRDGQLLASGSYDGMVSLWDAATKTQLASFPAHTQPVFGLAFAAKDRRLVSGSEDGTLKIWDVATHALVTTLHDNNGKPSRIAVLPDGNTLVSANHEGTLHFWDLQSGQLRRSIKAHSGAIYGLAVTPDGTTVLSTGQDLRLKAWDPRTLHQRASLPAFGQLTGLVVSSDGRKLVAGTFEGSLRVWTTPGDNDIYEFHRRQAQHDSGQAAQEAFALACWACYERQHLEGQKAVEVLQQGLDALQKLQRLHPSDEQQRWIGEFEKALREVQRSAG